MRTLFALFTIAALGACAAPIHSANSANSSTSGSAPPAILDGSAPFVVEDMGGQTHDLRAGGAVALVFWQTWCKSCRSEAPEIIAAAKEHGDRMRFYGVVAGPDSVVDDGLVAKTAHEWGLNYPQIRDRDLALSHRFDVTGTPDIVVIDEGGAVLFRGHRAPEDWGALQ